jgi:hypothetical protein
VGVVVAWSGGNDHRRVWRLSRLPRAPPGHLFGFRAVSEIAYKALRASFSAFWLAFIALILAIGFIKGWDATLTVPVWTLAEALWWAATLILGVQAMTTIVLYRGGSSHA